VQVHAPSSERSILRPSGFWFLLVPGPQVEGTLVEQRATIGRFVARRMSCAASSLTGPIASVIEQDLEEADDRESGVRSLVQRSGQELDFSLLAAGELCGGDGAGGSSGRDFHHRGVLVGAGGDVRPGAIWCEGIAPAPVTRSRDSVRGLERSHEGGLGRGVAARSARRRAG